jgi:hypothetical protein
MQEPGDVAWPPGDKPQGPVARWEGYPLAGGLDQAGAGTSVRLA